MNKMKLSFLSRMENESFARTSVIAFLMPLNPTTQDVMEIKTIMAEGIVNAIIHGYEGKQDEMVQVEVGYDENKLITIIISDNGVGIEDIELAMQPMYTSKKELERSGMGMSIMGTFADSFDCFSKVNCGTKLVIQKQL